MNRRRRNERYVVVDNLLYELYLLKPDTIQYQVIHGQPYLVNLKKIKQAEIGFRVRMKEKLDDKVPSGTMLNQINNILNEEQKMNYYWDPINNCESVDYDYQLYVDYERKILDEYEHQLCLSNAEKYLFNILLDRFFDDRGTCLSLRDMEANYRKMAMSRRNISLNNETYRRYMLTLKALMEKEVYLKTGFSFRKECYACNNLEIKQKLLTIKDYISQPRGNKFQFNYSLGAFGNVLKRSKRFCTIPDDYYKVQFKQVKKTLIAQYLARMIYVEKLYARRSINHKSSFDIKYTELFSFIDEPFKSIKSNYSRYVYDTNRCIYRFLKDMKEEKIIWGFDVYTEVSTSYWDKQKTKEDLQREKWFDELDEFHCIKKDKIKKTDNSTTKTTIYYFEPSIEEQKEAIMRDYNQSDV